MSFRTVPAVHLAPPRTGLAARISRTLAHRGVDGARLPWLVHTLGAEASEIRLAVGSTPYLGICPDGGPVVYCLPPQPMRAGFEVRWLAGRLRLRLAGRGLRPPLFIGGELIGPAPDDERDITPATGELGYTVCRLTLMARSWLPPAPDPTRLLFDLITEAWRHGTTSRLGGGFSVHRANFTAPIATGPVTNRLELVTNRGRGGHRLVNIYPIPPQREETTR